MILEDVQIVKGVVLPVEILEVSTTVKSRAGSSLKLVSYLKQIF